MPQECQKMKILFLCTGNSCRSQMAEGSTRQLKSDRVEAHSAGIEPKGYAYFRKRLSEARRDVEHGLQITLDHFSTRELQERALNILQLKLDILWTMLDCMWVAYIDKKPPYHNVPK